MKALPKHITFYRLRAGMLKCDLAQAAGLSEKYVGEIENGTKPGSARSLKRIANVLGVEVEDITDLEIPNKNAKQSSVA